MEEKRVKRGWPYICDNEGCPHRGRLVIVERGKEATCPVCGWFMVGKPREGEDYEPA